VKTLTPAAGLLVLLLVPAVGFAQSAESRFNRLDSNGDGKVDKREYNSDAAFSALDTDKNNRVSAAELEAVLGPQGDGRYSAADRIRNIDRNQDGELTDEELRRGANSRFQWLDTNDDESVDLAEFKSGFGIPAPITEY
jgi:Ca2+-binding EF-hand superfamily protein